MAYIKKTFCPILMLLPAFLLFTIGIMIPIIQSTYMSFFEWNGIPVSPLKYVGVSNYVELISNEYFWLSMKNVGIFILQGTFIQLPIAFLLALFISRGLKGSTFFRTAFFLPVIIPLTAVGMMWKFITLPDIGGINRVASFLGFSANFDLLGDPKLAMFTTVMVSAWIYAGYNMIIFSAGLTSIPEDIYQAAEIDGATSFRRLLYITIPLMKDSFNIYFVTMITGSLKSFDLIYAMTGGGPNRATYVPGVQMYLETFKFNHYGLGSCIATVILILGLAGSIATNRYLLREK